VFCGDDLLVSFLHPSNIGGSRYAGAIIRLLTKRFRQAWPEVKILLRGDCAFGRKHIMHWCEYNDVDYVIAISSNKHLQTLAKALTAKRSNDYFQNLPMLQKVGSKYVALLQKQSTIVVAPIYVLRQQR